MRPPHTTGILVNPKQPLFRQFPTEYHSHLQWWELLNRTQVMQFTNFPEASQPTVQSIDTWFINSKMGTLFEANITVTGRNEELPLQNFHISGIKAKVNKAGSIIFTENFHLEDIRLQVEDGGRVEDLPFHLSKGEGTFRQGSCLWQ